MTAAYCKEFRKDKVMAGNVTDLTVAIFDEVVNNSDVPVVPYILKFQAWQTRRNTWKQ